MKALPVVEVGYDLKRPDGLPRVFLMPWDYEQTKVSAAGAEAEKTAGCKKNRTATTPISNLEKKA
jgi:hypothetical protein